MYRIWRFALRTLFPSLVTLRISLDRARRRNVCCPIIPQAPAYFEGSLTVRLLRPFLRRRLSTARPHLVDMRSLKPCLRMRRLLRGLYVGFPIYASSEILIKFEDRRAKLLHFLGCGNALGWVRILLRFCERTFATLTFPQSSRTFAAPHFSTREDVTHPRRSLVTDSRAGQDTAS